MWLLQRQWVAWPPRRRCRIPFVTDQDEQRGLGGGQVAGARCPLSKRSVGLVGPAVSSSCKGAVDDDRLQFWQFLVTIALLSVAGLSVVTVVLRRSDRLALLLVAEFSAAIFVVAAAPASTSRPPAADLARSIRMSAVAWRGSQPARLSRLRRNTMVPV